MIRELALAVLLAGCARAAPAAPEPEVGAVTVATVATWQVAGDAERGRALFAEYECARCHSLAGVEPAPPARDCTGCHRAIHSGAYDAPEEALSRWRAHVVSLVHVPSLDGARARLSRDWIAAFLERPHDVRPGLAATMPRLPVDARDAADLATFLVPSEAPGGRALPHDEAALARGRTLIDALACTGCHAFSGVPPFRRAPVGTPLDPGIAGAPDLRHARARMLPEAIVRWLLDPEPPMPRVVRSIEDAEAIAAYLVHAPLTDPAPAPRSDAVLPLLDRPVTFAEVRERVFRRSCWHCHSDEGLALGEGGPGNTGGFGFPARGLDLSDYAGVMSGARGDDGERRSIFRDVDGVPLLVAVLETRAREERGELAALRGMPLGLPALSPEDVQLVRTWIAQGRPQ